LNDKFIEGRTMELRYLSTSSETLEPFPLLTLFYGPHPESTLFYGPHPESTLFYGLHPEITLFYGLHPESTLFYGLHPESTLFYGLHPEITLFYGPHPEITFAIVSGPQTVSAEALQIILPILEDKTTLPATMATSLTASRCACPVPATVCCVDALKFFAASSPP
jgi:hypothetical protein